MTATASIYHTQSGVISRVFTGPEELLAANVKNGESYIDGSYDTNTVYVVEGVVTERPAMVPSVSGMVVSNLPIPCTARIEDQLYEIDDGTLELDPELPGPYEVYLDAPPYLPCTVTIE